MGMEVYLPESVTNINEKSGFYRMAKRSGSETAAILDVAKRLDILHEDNYQKGREFMMLTKLAQKSDEPGSHTFTGSY
jgi:hypothetical protein